MPTSIPTTAGSLTPLVDQLPPSVIGSTGPVAAGADDLPTLAAAAHELDLVAATDTIADALQVTPAVFTEPSTAVLQAQAQVQVPPGQSFLERLQEMQQQYPTQLPTPVQELAVPDTGPMPPLWFLTTFAVLGLLWVIGMYASRVLTPERALIVTGTPETAEGPMEVIEAAQLPRDPALLFRLSYSAGTAAWAVVLIVTTLLSSEVAAVTLWVVYLPLMSAMTGATAWAGMAGAEQLKLSRAERSLDRLEADLNAGIYGELDENNPEDQAQLELLRHRAEQGRY